MKAKITKLTGKPGSSIEPRYWAVGICDKPEIGKGLYMSPVFATSKGEPFYWFASTEIKSIEDTEDGQILTTENSRWLFQIEEA